MSENIKIAKTELAWVDLAVHSIVKEANKAIHQRGYFNLVISGGSTPKPVYAKLASSDMQLRIDWNKVFIFWGDERCVPPTHPDSNYHMAKEIFLNHLPIPSENIFRILGELEPGEAARDYEQIIVSYFLGKEKRFDTVLLGIGEDGHTASLFPKTNALNEMDRWVIENPHPYTDSWRVTMTYPAINSARNIIFLVTGSNKSKIISDILQYPNTSPDYPAKRISGKESKPMWILDKHAAERILNIIDSS